MQRLLLLFFILFIVACSSNQPTNKQQKNEIIEAKKLTTEHYDLYTAPQQEKLLILFPCYPCDAANTKAEFDMVTLARENNTAVLMMNFNRHLWLTADEKKNLKKVLKDAVSENNLNTDRTFLGGFSSGGNVALILSDYLKASQATIQPKGVFIVDSPIDLLALYENAQKNIEKNFSEIAVQEAKWIVSQFEADFGRGDSSLKHYEKYSPYLFRTGDSRNLSNLSGVKIRFYTEPDSVWWKENRKTAYKEMNAFYIATLAEDLADKYGKNSVSLIQTTNKGYRANGERHPHSWAIVDQKKLMEWINE